MAIGEQVRDLEFLAQAFQELIETEQEFPVKVEGAKTLPYSATLKLSEPGRQELVVKLFRPLPPALAMGAWFDLVFSVQGKRYEGRFPLLGREGYLQYRFKWPQSLLSSDRRLWKRYPFRPRENVYVTAQDNSVPSHGYSGPLTNLSLGGFCFRVDRMLRLEDGMPVRPWANDFENGRILPMIRIHGLEREDIVEARGHTVRFLEADSEVHLAVQFQGMEEDGRTLLTRALAARDRKPGAVAGSRPSAGPRTTLLGAGPGGGSGVAGADAGDGEAEAGVEPETGDGEVEPGLEAKVAPPVDANLELVRRLDRRTTRMLVVAPDGEGRAAAIRLLQAAGFWRVEAAAELFSAFDLVKKAADAPFRLLLVDLEPTRGEGLEPVGAVRHMEPLLRSFGELPVVFLTQLQDPMLELLDKPGLGALALADPAARWVKVLDRLLKN